MQHAKETGLEIPKYPMVFMKAPTAAQNPGDPIVLPRYLRSDKVDFEAELGVVIGRPCKNVNPEEALSYVLGYVCANDVSARLAKRKRVGGQFCRGKTFDTFCPSVHAWQRLMRFQIPPNLPIRSFVNEDKMQESGTDDMIFDVPTLISFLSGSTTLLPGTLILTGTPSGVGEARNPKRYLVPGDEVTVEIEGLGILTNPVVEEVFEEEETAVMRVAILQFPDPIVIGIQNMQLVRCPRNSCSKSLAQRSITLRTEAVIVPGGFSFGDYLRCGAIARFSPIMKDLHEFADKGGSSSWDL